MEHFLFRVQPILEAVTTQAPTTGLSSAFQVALDRHNNARREHCFTPDLELDLEMSKVAQKIADRKVWGHSKEEERNFYGENIAWNTQATIENAIKQAVTEFHREIRYYNYDQPSSVGRNDETVQHFTQMVWKSTKKIGVGFSRMEVKGSEGWFMVFHYDPPGNYAGKFGENVMPGKIFGTCDHVETSTTNPTTKPTTQDPGTGDLDSGKIKT